MKVVVQLGDENKVIYLEPSHVNMNEASQNASSLTHDAKHATSVVVQSAAELPNVTTPWVSVTPPSTDTDDKDSFVTASESYEFVSTFDLLQAKNAGVPPSNKKKLTPGSRVFITGGSSHVNQVATVVKSTAQRVGVTLESDRDGKIRYFDPKSVSTQPGAIAASLYDVTDPVSQAFHEALGDQHPVEFHNSTASKVNQTLFGAIFGEDAVFFKVNTNNLLQLPKELRVPKQKRKLYLTVNKIHDKAKNLSCAYLWAESNQEVANRLLEIGAFDELSQTKAAARLDLLLSTASSSSTTPGTYHVHTSLSSSDFRIVPEHGSVGCGYIPRRMVDVLLGNGTTDVVAIQVRTVIPSLGVFKGVLTVKPNIDKIELPTSMQKVGASTSPTTANQDMALLMINQTGIYPYAARILRQQNHFADEREIPKMARWMLIQKGVSNSYLCKKNRHHDMCKGLMDPTDGLPSGCVFSPVFRMILICLETKFSSVGTQ